jgi:ribosome maturation protein SDO1
LAKAFGAKTPLNDIITEILKKGEMQVGEKERNAQLERIHNEVIDLVASKLVDPRNKRVYTVGIIGKALDQLSSQGGKHGEGKGSGTATLSNGDDSEKANPRPTWTGVVTTRSAKSQALDAMKALIAWQPIPISRARMRLRITCATSILKQAAKPAPKKEGAEDGAEGDGEKGTGTVKDRILSYVEQVESQDTMGSEWEVQGFVEPGAFKGLSEFIGAETKGKGRIEVLDMAVTHEEN